MISTEEALLQTIVEAATEVHETLGGPGLLESIYESALCHELSLQGISCQRQVPIPVIYKSKEVREPLFLDVIVEEEVILEIKATGRDYPMYRAQLATYLRLMGKPVGLLLNFGKPTLKEGIIQIINP